MYTDLILNTLRCWIFLWKMQKMHIHYWIGNCKDRKELINQLLKINSFPNSLLGCYLT